jgi:hypothetical protein
LCSSIVPKFKRIRIRISDPGSVRPKALIKGSSTRRLIKGVKLRVLT